MDSNILVDMQYIAISKLSFGMAVCAIGQRGDIVVGSVHNF
jgi:hypothetical protein